MPLLGIDTIYTFTPTEQRWFMEYYYHDMLTRKELDATIRQFMIDLKLNRLQQAKGYMKNLAAERKLQRSQRQLVNNQAHLGRLERGDSQNVFGFNWG